MPNQNDTKSKIIEAVEELIATKGVNNFSLRDIANYLDISTGKSIEDINKIKQLLERL